MPYPASVIAYAFVQKGIEEGNPVTQMKLQKMVYFAHGYHLAKYGTPLISEAFEAWKYGPVVLNIYQNYKLYGSDHIITTDLIVDVPKDMDIAGLNATALDAIDYTWRTTQKLSASQLSMWTHKAGSPWAQVYNPDQWSVHINDESIKEYFTEVLSTVDNSE